MTGLQRRRRHACGSAPHPQRPDNYAERGPRGFLRFAALCLALVPSAVFAQAPQEVVEYYGLDALGSVRMVFDPNGDVTGRMDYGPFGESLTSATGLPSRAYAGLFRDGEAGLDAAEARSYQVRTGRFSTVDPVYDGVFEPQRWNRYAYAQNNPISYSDPAGLLADSCTMSHWTTFDDEGIPTFHSTSNCTAGGGGGGWTSDQLNNFLFNILWPLQDALFISDTQAYFGGQTAGEPTPGPYLTGPPPPRPSDTAIGPIPTPEAPVLTGPPTPIITAAPQPSQSDLQIQAIAGGVDSRAGPFSKPSTYALLLGGSAVGGACIGYCVPGISNLVIIGKNIAYLPATSEWFADLAQTQAPGVYWGAHLWASVIGNAINRRDEIRGGVNWLLYGK